MKFSFDLLTKEIIILSSNLNSLHKVLLTTTTTTTIVDKVHILTIITIIIVFKIKYCGQIVIESAI